MSDIQAWPVNRTEELRSAFDQAFAQAPGLGAAAKEDLLAIRLGAAAYALRLSEIAGLIADKKVTRVPSRASGLLGIAGFRGTIMPVYDLGALLGYPPAETPRWFVIAANTPLALAFEAFDGHIRVARDAVAPQEIGDRPRKHIRELVRAQDAVRAIVDLTSVLEAVTKQAP